MSWRKTAEVKVMNHYAGGSTELEYLTYGRSHLQWQQFPGLKELPKGTLIRITLKEIPEATEGKTGKRSSPPDRQCVKGEHCTKCDSSKLLPLHWRDGDGTLHEAEGDRKWCPDCEEMVPIAVDWED